MSIDDTFALAFQHQQVGHLADAEAICRQILAVQPNHANSLHLLGLIADQTGRFDLAVELIRKAIVLDPANSSCYCNLGETYRKTGRLNEAIAEFRRSLQITPQAETYNNLGLALHGKRLLDEAITAYRQAVTIKPDMSVTYSNLGNVFKDQGLMDEAISAYRRALELEPDNAMTFSNLIAALLYHQNLDDLAIAEENRGWNRQFGEPRKRFILPHTNDRNPDRRLRIGYVSPEFRDHVTGRYLLPLFKHHDHQTFEIMCYSGVVRPDDITKEFKTYADKWRNVLGLTDEALCEMIRQDGVDILVDLTQHLAGNRLPMFARQPAPMQISFAGYPASAGLDAIRYRISGRYLEPETGPGAEEQVFLIDSFWCYDPCGVDVPVNELPLNDNGNVTFGCLNNFCKINEVVLKLWARVLGKVKGSRLIMLSAVSRHQQRTWELLQREGIDAHRVEFVEPRGRKAYLELYHRLDIALDPFPSNGHTTTLDALWMGVPVVTLIGKHAVSRASFSQLSNLGLQDLAASSEDEYVGIAAQLAGDRRRLTELRSTLRPRMEASVLMNAPHFAHSIETVYRTMWRQWCTEQNH